MMKQLQIYLPDENPAAISDSEDDMSLMDEIMAAWGCAGASGLRKAGRDLFSRRA